MRSKSDEDERHLERYHVLYTFCFLWVIHAADKTSCPKEPQIWFSNIKHKGKTLTASVVNKSLPWERKQQTGGGWHACRRKLNTIFFLPAQVAICCSDQESLFPVDFKRQVFRKFLSQLICWYHLRVWYSYHWIFKRKIHFLSCSGKHVYSSCTDAGWFRLTCHTHVVSNKKSPFLWSATFLIR